LAFTSPRGLPAIELLLRDSRVVELHPADHAGDPGVPPRDFEHELGSCEEITPETQKRAGWLQRLRWKIGWFLVTSLDYTVTRRLALRVP